MIYGYARTHTQMNTIINLVNFGFTEDKRDPDSSLSKNILELHSKKKKKRHYDYCERKYIVQEEANKIRKNKKILDVEESLKQEEDCSILQSYKNCSILQKLKNRKHLRQLYIYIYIYSAIRRKLKPG